MKPINFRVSPEEHDLIRRIVERAYPLFAEAGYEDVEKLDIHMDITACHANGCPLKLQALLDADDFQFAHDVFGISGHMNRRTGQLEGCFLPRYAVPETEVSCA